MPKIDFSQVSDAEGYTPLPDGEYPCQLTDIELDRTRSGDEMWKLRWKVATGEHTGRLLFDNLVFSEKAMSRVKLVCSVLGIDTSAEVDLEPVMLLDKEAMISTFQQEYTDQQGQTKMVNKIPFDGYSWIQQDDDDTPF